MNRLGFIGLLAALIGLPSVLVGSGKLKCHLCCAPATRVTLAPHDYEEKPRCEACHRISEMPIADLVNPQHAVGRGEGGVAGGAGERRAGAVDRPA